MFFICLATLVLLFLFYELYWKRRLLPPGPIPVPFFGNTLGIWAEEPGHSCLSRWRKQYGPIFTYWMGTDPIIMLADFPTARIALVDQGEKFLQKPELNLKVAERLRGGYKGLLKASGALWKDQRRFVLGVLHGLGTRGKMEDKVMMEFDDLVLRIEGNRNCIRVLKHLQRSTASIINLLLFGFRFEQGRLAEFEKLQGISSRLFTDSGHPIKTLLLCKPWLRMFPYWKDFAETNQKFKDVVISFIQKQIEGKKQQLQIDNEDDDDLVECFLREQRKRQGTLQEEFYSEEQLLALCIDFWTAGYHTTASTIAWAICFLVNYPQIQEKLQQELDRVVQPDHRITYADRASLPLLNAFIEETHRVGNIGIITVLRSNTETVQIGGYAFPRGSIFVPLRSVIHNDEQAFPEPHSFKPERFLDEDGNFVKNEKVFPFSLGMRSCIGEKLARLEIFLFISNLLHKYKINAKTRPSMKAKFCIGLHPEDFDCHFINRHASH